MDAQKLLNDAAPEAVAVLIALVHNPALSASARLGAIGEILDRTLGKACAHEVQENLPSVVIIDDIPSVPCDAAKI